jgi:hypothetical protein
VLVPDSLFSFLFLYFPLPFIEQSLQRPEASEQRKIADVSALLTGWSLDMTLRLEGATESLVEKKMDIRVVEVASEVLQTLVFMPEAWQAVSMPKHTPSHQSDHLHLIADYTLTDAGGKVQLFSSSYLWGARHQQFPALMEFTTLKLHRHSLRVTVHEPSGDRTFSSITTLSLDVDLQLLTRKHHALKEVQKWLARIQK